MPTIVQAQNVTGDATTTSLSATYASTPTPGNRLFAMAVSDATLDGTGMASAGWTLAASKVADAGLYIWSKIAGASEPTTVTVVPTTAAPTNLRITEISGLDTNAIDAVVTNSGGTAATSISTGTTGATSDADEWALAVFGIARHRSGTGTVTAYSNGFVETAQVANAAGNKPLLATATKTLSATGTVECTATLSVAEDHPAGLVVTYRLAPPITLAARLSGGATNADPRLSHGGVESSVAVDGTLFSDVPNTSLSGGLTDYRLIYLRNLAGGSGSIKAYVAQEPGPTQVIGVAAATEAAGATVAATADVLTPPSGVTFVESTDAATGADLGTIAVGQSRGVWIRRRVLAGSAPSASDPGVVGFHVVPL